MTTPRLPPTTPTRGPTVPWPRGALRTRGAMPSRASRSSRASRADESWLHERRSGPETGLTLRQTSTPSIRQASMGLPWEEALLGIDMATLLDAGEPEVVAAAARSREILTGLSARPFLDRLDAALGEV